MAEALMTPVRGALAELMRVRPQHLRSIEVARDYADPASTAHYVVTPFIEATFKRLDQALQACSTARAWRLTGDYGSGKSSFALAFARHAAREPHLLPEALRGTGAPGVRLEPVLVIGEREPLGRSLAKGLRATLRRVLGRVPREFDKSLDDGAAPAVLAATEAAALAVRRSGRADGLLVVLDELGRNLEHAAATPEHGDVHLLQQLAEVAARSAETPVVVLAILHQAVTAYARDLPSLERREWEKVSGRFEEVVFAPPLEQTAVLAAAALDVDRRRLPERLAADLSARMRLAVRSGWYGPGAPEEDLVGLAPGLAPLDPVVLPVLARALRRFGQNERSLFSFLSSAEPHGLMEHARQARGEVRPYGLQNLYDYLATNLSSALSSGAAATRWGVIDAVVRSAAARDELEGAALRAVGVVNVLDDPGLALTPELLSLALAGPDPVARAAAAAAVRRLTEGARVLYDRGAGGGLCLWPHTSVDIESAFSVALNAVQEEGDVVAAVRSVLPSQPLVARRHYVVTGTLRHFEVLYCAAPDLPAALAAGPDLNKVDGRVLVALSRTERERAAALAALNSFAGWTSTLVVGVPEPVGTVAPLLRDLRAWRWVAENTPALAGDRLAREEVSRQTAAAEDRLRRSLVALLDLRGGGALTTRWLHRGATLAVRSGRQFVESLSDICDMAYDRAPLIRNELVNRRLLSSAAARARTVLVEALAHAPDAPYLGLDGTHTPPEMAIYLSVLRAGGVHVEGEGGRWRVMEPSPDPLRLRPALDRVAEVLTQVEDRRVPFEEVARALRTPPYGLRDGVIPLVLAIYLAIHWHRTAVYEEGTYLEQVGGPEFTRMLKEPEHFAVQHCAVEGVRAEVFTRLAAVVGIATPASAEPDLLDVVRPLLKFVARLPDHARRTRNLSVTAAAVRAALLRVQDPTALIFSDLPKACGFQPISGAGPLDESTLDEFVAAMTRAVRELGDAYPALLDRIVATLGPAMEAEGGLEGLHATLSRRAERLLPVVAEPELKSFALRLADRGLPARAWLEALASFLARKPPERWAEPDEREYYHRLKVLARRYRRVQTTVDDPAGSGEIDLEPGRVAFRLVVTAGDGRELEELVRGGEQDARVDALEARFREILAEGGRAGLLAAARALVAFAAEDGSGEPAQTEIR